MRTGFMAAACAIFILPLLLYPALAQNNPVMRNFSATYQTCVKEADISDPAIVDCNYAEVEAQDVSLNDVYRQVMTKMAGPQRENVRLALRDAERAWVTYMKAECDYRYAKEEGGSLARREHSYCLLNMTYDRVEVLRGILKSAN